MNDTETQIIQYLSLGLHPIPLEGKVARFHWKDFVLNRNDSLGDYIRKGAPEGIRHTVLVKYIGAMHGTCFREEEALEKLIEWNAKNRPPLSMEELVSTLQYCYEKWG